MKQLIEEVALAEPYMDEEIPTRWLQFENDLNRLKTQQDNFYASLDQVLRILFFYPVYKLFIDFSRFVK